MLHNHIRPMNFTTLCAQEIKDLQAWLKENDK